MLAPLAIRSPVPTGPALDATLGVAGQIGAPQLSLAWTNPDFDPSEHAFHYGPRAPNPHARWSTYDAVRLERRPRPDLPVSIQERAWS